MVSRVKGRRDERRGIAAVELAATMPLVMGLLVGMWDVSRMTEIRQLLANAAREGARQASTAQLTDTELTKVVKDYLTNAKVPVTHATVTIKNLTSPGTLATAATQLDQLEVVVTVPFSDVQLVGAHVVIGKTATLKGRAVCFSVRNKPYAAPPEPGIE